MLFEIKKYLFWVCYGFLDAMEFVFDVGRGRIENTVFNWGSKA